MKFDKKAKYEYEINGIKDENGYTRWYNKETTGKKLRLAGTYSQAFMIAAMIAAARLFKDDIKAFGILQTILPLILTGIIIMFAVAPLREILHLIPVSEGRLDRNCIMSFRNHFSVYIGSVNRSQILISLALPLIVFIPVFGFFSFFTSGIVRLCAVFLLIDSCFMCHSDIYMLFFCIKNIGKNDTVFGEYKKAKK